MASAAQVTANHQNAQSSTGPTTAAGKSRSRLNAFRHGLTSQVVVLPTEDVTAYEKFSSSYHLDLQPKGILETQLVQTLADIQWRLNRAKAHEAAIFAMAEYQTAPDSPALSPEFVTAFGEAQVRLTHAAALNSLSLHEHRWQKMYFTSLKQLQELQAARSQREAEEMNRAVSLLKYHKAKQLPFEPQHFGFVLTEYDIELHLWRTGTFNAADHARQDALRTAKTAAESAKTAT